MMAWVCIDWKRFHPTPNIIARKKKSSSDKKNKNLIKILCGFMYRFHISLAVRTIDFDYPLPEELIADRPLPDRSASRMMVIHRIRA